MHLKFEIRKKRIERKNIQVLASRDSRCSFNFDLDWIPLEKYAIFWTKKGKSYIRYLGTGKKCECSIPEEIFEQNIFSLQVWASDDLCTQKLQLGAIPNGYTISKPLKECEHTPKTYKEDDPEVILYQVFSQLETKIDNIKYNNGFLECYANNKLVCKTPIFKSLKDEIQANIKELMPYFEVEENGDIYIIYPYEKEKKGE